MIACDNITAELNSLLATVNGCKTINPNNFIKMIEILSAVVNCTNVGDNYDTVITENHITTTEAELVSYPINTYHAMSIVVKSGSIVYGGSLFYEGYVNNIELTTTNQTQTDFTINMHSEVFVEYIIKTPETP